MKWNSLKIVDYKNYQKRYMELKNSQKEDSDWRIPNIYEDYHSENENLFVYYYISLQLDKKILIGKTE